MKAIKYFHKTLNFVLRVHFFKVKLITPAIFMLMKIKLMNEEK